MGAGRQRRRQQAWRQGKGHGCLARERVFARHLDGLLDALDPGYAMAPRLLGVVLAYMGRHDEAQTFMRRARARSALRDAPCAFGSRGAAGREIRRGAEVRPSGGRDRSPVWIGYFKLAQLQVQLGQYAEALDSLAAGERFNGNSKMISLRGYILARQGRRDDALQVCTTLDAIGRERPVPPRNETKCPAKSFPR